MYRDSPLQTGRLSLCSAADCAKHIEYIVNRTTRHTPALGGRRTSPACGSFRRPLNYNAGINEGGVTSGGVNEVGGTWAEEMRTQSMRTFA